MVNLVEFFFGLAIGTGLAGVVAFALSRRGGESGARYFNRMKVAFIVAGGSLLLAVIGELLLRMDW